MSFLIVAQGNPQAQYLRSKHNVGWQVLDRLGLEFRIKGDAGIAELTLGDEKGWAMKPLTYYNATGRAVAPFARFYKIPEERILVIHDELDLPLGKIRFKGGGGNAGNYGLESITQALGSSAFHRLRIGIGKPPTPEEGADWVLSGFRPDQLPVLERVLEAAAEGAKVWVVEGFRAAQQRFNGLDLAKPPSQGKP
ncbi:MAG: aminoacyl-tRNA hydrolase [Meiothermus sp.]